MATFLLDQDDVSTVMLALKAYSEHVLLEEQRNTLLEQARQHERHKVWALRDKLTEWCNNLPSSAEL